MAELTYTTDNGNIFSFHTSDAVFINGENPDNATALDELLTIIKAEILAYYDMEGN